MSFQTTQLQKTSLNELHAHNLAQMFIACAKQLREKTALKVKLNGSYQSISYNHFLKEVIILAAALKNKGIQHGDKVCILSESRPEWFYADMAILSLGAASVPIYPTSSPEDFDYIAKHSEAKLLFISSQEQLDRLSPKFNQWEDDVSIIVFDDVESKERIKSLSVTLDEFNNCPEQERQQIEEGAVQVSGHDLASIIYTSGTTGTPKGVMLSHANFLSNCIASRAAMNLTSRDTLLSMLPLSHVFERMAGYYLQILTGTTVAFAENMNTIAENLLEISPTMVTAVPRFFEKFYDKLLDQVNQRGGLSKIIFSWAIDVGMHYSKCLQSKKAPSFFLSAQYSLAKTLVFNKIKNRLGGKIRFFISGGAPLPKNIAEFFHSLGVLILEGYGLTETSPVISCNQESGFKFGSVGTPVDRVKIKLSEEGEILTKGPHIMLGYFKNDEATQEVIKDGWFYTGDIGRIDEEGYLHITDRKKDIIVTAGGKNISPQKIEGMLITDDLIDQVFVYGDKQKFLVALIVPNFEKLEVFAKEQNISFASQQELLKNKELYDLINQRIEKSLSSLAHYENIKYFKLLSEALSLEKGDLTPTLKMKRKKVFEKYQKVIDNLYLNAS